jgi:putative transposase
MSVRSLSRLSDLARCRRDLVQRAEIVLLCAENLDNGTVAEMVGVTRQTVGKWRGRFRTQGFMGLYDEARSGRPRSIDDERIMELLYTTLHAEPPGEQDRWSVRTAAEEMEISKSAVQRAWSAFGV